MIDVATKKPNLHARPIKHGDELNAYHGNGCATAIPIAWMAPTKMPLNTTAANHNLAVQINSVAPTEDASTK